MTRSNGTVWRSSFYRNEMGERRDQALRRVPDVQHDGDQISRDLTKCCMYKPSPEWRRGEAQGGVQQWIQYTTKRTRCRDMWTSEDCESWARELRAVGRNKITRKS
jgi:hypothetical protein